MHVFIARLRRDSIVVCHIRGRGRTTISSLDEVVVTADCAIANCAICRPAPPCSTRTRSKIAGVQHFQDVLGLVPNLNWSAGTSRPRYFQLRGIGELCNGRARRILRWDSSSTASTSPASACRRRLSTWSASKCCAVRRARPTARMRSPADRGEHARAAARARAQRQRDVGDYGTRGANGVLGGPSATAKPPGASSPATIAATAFAATPSCSRDDTNGYDESSARLQAARAAARDTCASTSPRCGPISTMATTRSRSTTRAPRCPTSPGQDAQLARALAMRLDYDGAATFDVVSRTAFGNSRSVYSFDGDWGNDGAGARTALRLLPALRPRPQTVSEDLRIVSRDIGGRRRATSRGSRACMRCAPTKTCSSTTSGAICVYGDGESQFASDYRATNLAAYGELEWRARRSDGARGRCARRAPQRRLPRHRRRGVFARTKPCSADRLSLRRAFGERRTGYATLARGYKAGGFNIGADVPAAAQLRRRNAAEPRARLARAASADDVADRRRGALLHAPP